MAECGRWFKKLLIKRIVSALASDTAALEHSVLSRKETLVWAVGNTNRFSQDGCVLNLQIALTQCFFRVLRETYYFCFLCWCLATQKFNGGCAKRLVLVSDAKTQRCQSLFKTFKESIHVRWSSSECSTRQGIAVCGLSFTNKDPFH